MGTIFQGIEPWIILLIILLLLGPSKLPALARAMGQAVREFRKATQGAYDEPSRKPQDQQAQPAPAEARDKAGGA